jgi:photosystem II stability/assembly factor-like uncharacterized protein
MLAAILCLASGATVLAQGTWEFLGPGVGYRPEALCVTDRAVYVGMTNEDWSGLGLHRYRFAEGQWDLFAYGGSQITGVAVWGELDENIVLIRCTESRSSVMRSMDGGQNWTVSLDVYGLYRGLSQAPSDPSHLVMTDGFYSTDGGQSWSFPPWSVCDGVENYDVGFDPSDADVVYRTGMNMIYANCICKSTDAGAHWDAVCLPCVALGIEVKRGHTNHVMGASGIVNRSTDAGATWSSRSAPFYAKVLCSPRWAAGSFFVAGGDTGALTYEVWQTWDLGETWAQCGDGLPDRPGSSLFATSLFLEGHPTEPVLYAALEGSGVWRRTLSVESVPGTGGTDRGLAFSVYPNPTTNVVRIQLSLPRPEQVFLRLFDVRGRLVSTLREGTYPAGSYAFDWRGSGQGDGGVPSGIYYLRLETGGFRQERTIILVR